MSDERKIEEELDSDDDVEAHKKIHTSLNEEASDDGDDYGDVEAHIKTLVGSSTLSRNGFRGPGNRALVLSEHLLEVAQQGHPRGTA